MSFRRLVPILGLAALPVLSGPALSHGGGLNAQGCHNQTGGSYHCHRSQPPQLAAQTGGGDVYFPNCTAARAAGFRNIRRGEPGYGPHLDRDNDGIACES